jgi:hypothetical protein
MALAEKTKIQVAEAFASALAAGEVKHYKKVGKVLFRHCVPGESVITTCGGKVETIKKAGDHDVIIQNVQPGGSAETYIIGGAKFKERYEVQEDQVHAINGQRWTVGIPTGEIDAFVYQDEPITFMAPWGQPMLCEPGDMLCSAGKGDIYRIARAEFDFTYVYQHDVKPPEA